MSAHTTNTTEDAIYYTYMPLYIQDQAAARVLQLGGLGLSLSDQNCSSAEVSLMKTDYPLASGLHLSS